MSEYVTDEAVERAAIATYDEMQHPNWRAPLWDEIDEPGQERFLNAARAALEAAAPLIAAKALRDFADRLDREAAEAEARRAVADVRCSRCDLRYEERQEYSCVIPGTAHTYDERELDEVREVVVEPTYDGDQLRARADQIAGAES